MATLTVRDTLKAWIDEQVEVGGYASAEELVEEAILALNRPEPTPMSLDELRDKLRRSEESGISTRTMDEIFHDAVRRYEARQAARG